MWSQFPPIRRLLPLGLLAVFVLAGCEKRPLGETVDLYQAKALCILPSTAVADWTWDGQADGLLVYVRAEDNFHDPSKAPGDYLIELYSFREASADRRGERIGFWLVRIDCKERQEEYWDPVTLAYRFQCSYVQPVAVGKKYVLTVTYNSPFRNRLFAQQVLDVRAKPGTKEPMIVNTNAVEWKNPLFGGR